MHDREADSSIKVSVHMPAYNHEAYLAEAIESVLMQRVDFKYEIVIGEDCSGDATRSIVTDYAERFPEIVRPLFHEQNLGMYENDRAIIRHCRGKYIAWLESDDCFTSPDKLQKQVDLLDAHPDYAACFHWAGCIGNPPPASWRPGPPAAKPFFTLDDLLESGHFVPSCTAMFRSELVRVPAPWTSATPFLEVTYFVHFALHGKIGFIDEQLAAFRSHGQSHYYGTATRAQHVKNAIHAHRLIGRFFGLRDRKSYRSGLARLYANLEREYRKEGRPLLAAAARCRSLLGAVR
jgi:glycosyltransferase involved in cell wall biosynthesis